MQELLDSFNGNGWILVAFSAVLTTLVINYVVVRILRRALVKFESTKHVWDDTFVRALIKPLGFFIWLLGINFAIQVVTLKTQKEHILQLSLPVRNILIIALFVWFLIRFISEFETALLSPKRKTRALDKTTIGAMCQLLRAAVIITALLIVLQTLNIPISGVLAFGGVGGIAIGFAAKDWLSNFFGGLMIYLDRPFQVGDWISSPDKKIEGTVEHIGWRLTRIRKFDKRPLYVPNGIFSSISIENPSRMTNRRIYTNVGLRYDDATKVDKILKDVRQMLKEHPEIDQNVITLVNLVEFGPSALNFMVYTFTKTTDWESFQHIQQDVFLKVINIIDKNGAQCAFPTTTLHVPEGVLVNHATKALEVATS